MSSCGRISQQCRNRSSRANVGADKDSNKRQRMAIEVFAKAAGYEIVETFCDAAVSGADSVGDPSSGFAECSSGL